MNNRSKFMKKAGFITLAISIAVSSSALAAQIQEPAEPLLLPPLNTVLSSSPANYNATTTPVTTKTPIGGGIYEATYTPASYMANAPKYDENMVPQNAAAKGEPTVIREPRVRIETKQRSQGNSYWNPGGKGTKSYF